jgi:hypothetical protein
VVNILAWPVSVVIVISLSCGLVISKPSVSFEPGFKVYVLDGVGIIVIGLMTRGSIFIVKGISLMTLG